MLLASDLESLSLLQEVRIIVEETQEYWDSYGPGIDMMERELLIKTLERFVPWKGYPHKLLGKSGIMHVDEGGIFEGARLAAVWGTI